MKYLILYLLPFILPLAAIAQQGTLKGTVSGQGKGLEYITVTLQGTTLGTTTGEKGNFEIAAVPQGKYSVAFSAVGYEKEVRQVTITGGATAILTINMQESRGSLNEVVVTGVTRATELRKSPVPIATIGRKEMDANANNNIIDAIVRGVPGVTAVTTGPNISKPFIRGMGYNRVLTMYDGVRQEGQQWGDEHGIEVDQYGIEKAEIVKGPASLIYGSDATAGVINMIPRYPKKTEQGLKGDAVAEYRTNNGMAAASAGIGYRKNDWAYTLRTSAKIAHDYRNATDGLVYNTGFKEYNFAASAGVDKPWGYTRFAATAYDNLQEIPDGSRDSATRAFTRQVRENDSDDVKQRPLVTAAELSSYAIGALHQHIQHYRLYNQSLFKTKAGDINAALGVQQSVRREFSHPTAPAQPSLFVVLNTVNYDVKYNLPAWKGLETTLGINGMYQNNSSRNATDFPIPDYRLFDIGSFLFGKKTFGKVDISGGIRYDTRLVKWDDFYVSKDAATGFGAHAASAGVPGAVLQFPAFSHKYTGISGSLGAAWNISQRWIVKANIARGYRAPNITETGSNGLDPGAHIVYKGNRDFTPEFALQQDLGVIATMKNFSLAIEVFNNNIEHYIYQAKLYDAAGNPVIIVPGNVTYQYQQAGAHIYGGEINLALHPVALPWLTINQGVAITEGRNKNKTLTDRYGDAGRYLPFIPPFHSQTDVRVTLVKNKGKLSNMYVRAEAGYYAPQNHFYGVDNTETATAGYTLMNAGCGFTVLGKTGREWCRVYVQVDNLLDISYQSNLNRLKYFEYYNASASGKSGIYNIGRNAGLKIIVPF
ncbi:MAG: TonB-dependent receptor [Taibaiella sp.]|nr:TonB-dependent receptor [Taibaiella sp.]